MHIVTKGKQFAYAVDQRADDDGLLWDFEVEGDAVFHASNLSQNQRSARIILNFY